MSLSPFKSPSQLSNRPKNAPLRLSQALLITAGLAGLVGLFSGIIIRFSLSHSSSSNARFLSPLQTFPELPNWTPDLPDGGTAASPSLPPSSPDGTDTQRANNGIEANGTEADGAGSQGSGTQSDRSYAAPESLPTTPPDPFIEKNQNNDLSTQPSSSAEASVYPEASHPEDSSAAAPSAEDEYPQNYPTIEAPANGETPSYGGGQQ